MNITKPITQGKRKELQFLDVSFNQDQGCFAIAHEQGFLVYNTNPIELRVRRFFSPSSGSGSGVGHISMLHRTNYLALVGGGKNPKLPSNKVIIWDDLKRKSSLILSFMSLVLKVLLSRIRIVVVLKNQVLIYEFNAPPKRIATYETIDNDYGQADLSVCSTSQSFMSSSNSAFSISSSESLSASRDYPKGQILAFPGRTVGQIQLVDVSPEGQEKNSISIIKAHKSNIRCIALNSTGTLVASASETGTIIRVHSTHTTALIYEFRRGINRASITSMKFSPNETKLAVLSDKCTLHVYNLIQTNQRSNSDGHHEGYSATLLASNRQHVLNKLKLPFPIPRYFQSTWSFCSINTNTFRTDASGNEDHSSDSGVIGWPGNSSVIIVWKTKKIWEKFDIVEVSKEHSDDSSSASSGYELARYSWKSLEPQD